MAKKTEKEPSDTHLLIMIGLRPPKKGAMPGKAGSASPAEKMGGKRCPECGEPMNGSKCPNCGYREEGEKSEKREKTDREKPERKEKKDKKEKSEFQTKKSGSFEDKSNKPGMGGRSRQLESHLEKEGESQREAGAVAGMIARRKGFAPGQSGFHGGKKGK